MIGDRSNGFSLIEVSVVLLIVGVLATLAWPGFEQQLLRSRRADALTAIGKVRLAEERFRGHRASYGSLAEIGVADLSEAGHYRLEIPARDAVGFELLVRAGGAQARDRLCRYLRLRIRQMTAEYASGPDPSLANDAWDNQRCWNR